MQTLSGVFLAYMQDIVHVRHVLTLGNSPFGFSHARNGAYVEHARGTICYKKQTAEITVF